MLFTKTFEVHVVDKASRKEFVFEVQAKNKEKIEATLQEKYVVQDIKEKKSDLEKQIEELLVAPIVREDVLKFLNFLARALGRGVRFRKALEFLLVSEEKKSVRILIQKMIDLLQQQFSGYYDIFKEFPEHFDSTFLGIVKAGESTGSLPENILQYVEDQKKMMQQRKDIQGVFIKRGILLAVVMLIAVVIITFVIPQFAKLFENSPNIPNVLIVFSHLAAFFKNYGLLLLLSIIGMVVGLMFLLKRNYQFKKQFDIFLVKIPIVSGILRTYYTVQYLYFTGTLLMKNVNYIKIMDILIEQTQNIGFKEVFEIMKENVVKGVALPEMLKRSNKNLKTTYRKIPQGYLLPSLSQALEMGSATGNMGEVLYDAFLSYEVVLYEKIQQGINIFDKIFYTFIIILMGTLFYAMGSAMAALYKNAGSMV